MELSCKFKLRSRILPHGHPKSAVAFYSFSTEPIDRTIARPLSPFRRRVVSRRDGLVAKRLALWCPREESLAYLQCRRAAAEYAGLEDKFTKAFIRTASGHEATAAATRTSFLRTIGLHAAAHSAQSWSPRRPPITPHFCLAPKTKLTGGDVRNISRSPLGGLLWPAHTHVDWTGSLLRAKGLVGGFVASCKCARRPVKRRAAIFCICSISAHKGGRVNLGRERARACTPPAARSQAAKHTEAQQQW